MEMEASGETCDQTDPLQTVPDSDSKDPGVRQGAREEPELQMFSAADVKRRTASSGTPQCPHCRYRCGSRFSFQIHVGSQHPLHCEDVCVGRLGKVVFYQRTAKLFHCHICFFTSRDYAVLFEHLLSRHCRTVRKGGEVNDQLDPEVRPREQDSSPNPEENPDNKDQREQEASSGDCLKRKRSCASSGEDEDVGVSESPQAASEEHAAAVARYSERSSASCYDCKLCKQRCTSTVSLLRHVSSRHDVPKPHACEECSETFMLESLLTRHVNLHHTPDLHQCPYCPFTSSLRDLHQHLSQCRAEDRDDREELKNRKSEHGDELACCS